MYRIRPIQKSDLNALISFASQAQVGITNLPKNPLKLAEMLEEAIASFKNDAFRNEDFFLFILEDAKLNQPLGISGIMASTGYNQPIEYYKLKEERLPPLFQEVTFRYQILERVAHKNAPSEICALFLTPKAREHGLGKLLSLSRFHFIGAHRNRFKDQVFAEMRGVSDSDGQSPFWDGVGRRFFDVEFKELMMRRDMDGLSFSSLLPPYPILVTYLPEAAQNAIGKTHANTQPALHLLLDQGFRSTQEIDLFDGGPRLMVDRDAIKTIKESHVFRLAGIEKDIRSNPYLISNERLDFRAAFGYLNRDTLAIDAETAHLLEVKVGDMIRYSL